MINRKYIFITMLAAFVLLGCESGSNTDTTTSTESQDDQTTANDVDNDQNDQITPNDVDNDQDELIKESVVEIKPSNWYIRLVAEDLVREMKSGSTQLGELDVHDAVENHTTKALSPFGGTYLDIIFRDPAGVDTGDYKVNFHVYGQGSEQRWMFTVRTNDANADILLTWRGLYVMTPYIDDQGRQRYKEYRSLTNPLIKNMKLIDVSNGNENAAVVEDKVQIYKFNMEGQTERTFEWVVETNEVTIPVKVSTLSPLKTKTGIFDLDKLPMLKEVRFG